ncbi:MAG: hypothetical protein JWN56_1167 [Sphingobacteriales bacterium]|nr:hypothetical protein [Sphingobacteriales bacterium]
MQIFSLLIGTLLLASSCGDKSQKSLTDANYTPKDTTKNVIADKLIVLKFMANNQPCTANISTKYRDFNNKMDYSLSVFITVNQSKTKEGAISVRDSIQFNKLEQDILKSISRFSTCYIGNTDMNTYRDFIFYIKSKDQKDFSSQISSLKTKYPAIKSFVFEEDPKWEAVSELYSALK